MYSIANAVTNVGTMFTDTGTILVAVIATILVGAVALLGLGFGFRHLKKYVTGRKF